MSEIKFFARTPDFLPKLIFSSQRIEVSTRPNGAIRLDWIGAINTEELDPSEVARLISKLLRWQAESTVADAKAVDHG